MLEREILARVLLYAGSRAYARAWRQNTGGASYTSAGGGRRFIRFGVPGGGDISGILACGKRLELEVKTDTGRIREDQKNFGAMIQRMGGLYGVVRSEADAKELLDKHLQGCMVCAAKISHGE